MWRSVLDRQRELADAQEGMSTPSRGNYVGNPRVRLLDKHSKLERVPVYALPPNKPAAGMSSNSRDTSVASRAEQLVLPRMKRISSCHDRFIPQRRRQNYAASNYLLTRELPIASEDTNRLDVFDQIVNLETTWRKTLMKRALIRSNLIPDGRQQRILNIGKQENGNREGHGDANKNTEDLADGVWKSKARIKPLIGLTDIVADVPTMRHNWRRGLLDWGATNFIAAMVGTSILIFDSTSQCTFARPESMLKNINTKIRALKWNNAGTLIAVCTQNSETLMFRFEIRKFIWRRKCRCTIEKPEIACEVLCVAWTHTDKEIVVGCTEGRLAVYNVESGAIIDTVYTSHNHTDLILAVAFSPDDRYLASSGLNKVVRLLTWPSLTPFLSIGYYEPVQSLAWHPWEVGTMCIGGGFDDGSLSLWDIHRQVSLGYRKIPFLGVVKNMTWNRLSGELVVQWNYQNEESVHAVVTVLASLDQIVDVVTHEQRVMDIVWNPANTQIALRIKNSIKVWNFFGNETSNWFSAGNSKSGGALRRKRTVSAGRTPRFADFTIR